MISLNFAAHCVCSHKEFELHQKVQERTKCVKESQEHVISLQEEVHLYIPTCTHTMCNVCKKKNYNSVHTYSIIICTLWLYRYAIIYLHAPLSKTACTCNSVTHHRYCQRAKASKSALVYQCISAYTSATCGLHKCLMEKILNSTKIWLKPHVCLGSWWVHHLGFKSISYVLGKMSAVLV